MVYLFCSEDIQNWINEELKQYNNSEMVMRITHEFHQSKVIKKSDIYPNYQGEDEWIIKPVSYADFERFIWEKYDHNFIRKINRTSQLNIGIWYPGIYTIVKIKEYMNKLDNNTFPYLTAKAKDIIEGISDDNIQEALVRWRIDEYLVELGITYYSKIEDALNPLIDMDPKLVAELDYNKYAQLLQEFLEKKMGYQLYITDTVVDNLREMTSLSEYFGNSKYRKNIYIIKAFLPIFYQLLGRDDDAYTFLIDNINFISKDIIGHSEYLMALYRILLITKDEKKRKRVIGIFDEIFLNNSSVRKFIEVAENIKNFYLKYSEDIIERKKILLDNSTFFSGEKEYELITRWFKCNKVSGKFEVLLDDIKKDSGFRRSKGIENFKQLFYCLTSHRENLNIRIVPYRGENY